MSCPRGKKIVMEVMMKWVKNNAVNLIISVLMTVILFMIKDSVETMKQSNKEQREFNKVMIKEMSGLSSRVFHNEKEIDRHDKSILSLTASTTTNSRDILVLQLK